MCCTRVHSVAIILLYTVLRRIINIRCTHYFSYLNLNLLRIQEENLKVAVHGWYYFQSFIFKGVSRLCSSVTDLFTQYEYKPKQRTMPTGHNGAKNKRGKIKYICIFVTAVISYNIIVVV